MSEKGDKAQKLKEIQERLAAIQKKPISSQKSVSKTPEASKSLTDKKTEPSPLFTPTPKAKIKKVTEPEQKSEVKKDLPKSKITFSPEKKITQEEKNWKSNRFKNESSVASDGKKEEVKGNKKPSLSKIYTIISILVTVAVFSYFIYSFFLSSKDTDQLIESALPENISNDEIIEEDVAIEDDKLQEEENIVEDNNVQEEKIEEVPEEKIVAVQKNTPRIIKKSNPEPIAQNISSKVPNGFIISYSSNSTEKIAKKNVSDLIKKGFNASYYYMPDKNPKSPSLYKVYVGPYNDESAAMPDFKKVVDFNKGAFILKL